MKAQFSKKVVAERRQRKRTKLLKQAKILFNEDQSVYNALLRNISAGGASLDTTLAETLPEKFKLHIVTENVTVPCLVKWRTTEGVGVEF